MPDDLIKLIQDTYQHTHKYQLEKE
jgi:hypothetical protein